MLSLNELKQSRVYQEAKLEAIPRMVQFGLSVEAIAQLLDLLLEVVQYSHQ